MELVIFAVTDRYNFKFVRSYGATCREVSEDKDIIFAKDYYETLQTMRKLQLKGYRKEELYWDDGMGGKYLTRRVIVRLN